MPDVSSDIFFKELIVLAEPTPSELQDADLGDCIVNEQDECPVLLALADPTDTTNSYKNDFFNVLIYGSNRFLDYELYLQKDGQDLVQITASNINTYGNAQTFGISFIENETSIYNRVRGQINWWKVLNAHGVGCYRFRISKFDAFTQIRLDEYSYIFDLQHFHILNADKTVKIRYTLTGGNIGSILDDKEINNLKSLQLTNMIRIRGEMNFAEFARETETTRYKSGEMKKLKDETVEGFVLNIKRMHVHFRREIMVNVLMSDDIRVTDYNIKNTHKFNDYQIAFEEGAEPEYHNPTPYFSAEIPATQKFQNFRKKRQLLDS